jgi:hypothetical protein
MSMKVEVQFGQIYQGEQTWQKGDIMEVSEDLAYKLGSQVKPYTEPIPEPVKEEPVQTFRKPQSGKKPAEKEE